MPSYTDRILFESVHPLPQQNPLMNIYYGSVDYELSDHKPVTGLFEAKIKVVDQAKKQELIDKATELYETTKTISDQDAKKKDFLKTLNKLDFDEDEEGLSKKLAEIGELNDLDNPYRQSDAKLIDVDDEDDTEMSKGTAADAFRFEDHDLGNVNEFQRRVTHLVDYQSLSKLVANKLSDKDVEKELKKASVQKEEGKTRDLIDLSEQPTVDLLGFDEQIDST